MMRGARAERRAERRQVRASRVIRADPHRIFEILADPTPTPCWTGLAWCAANPKAPTASPRARPSPWP
jgi:uncharacterized protein YndB with AHSA1/START domain